LRALENDGERMRVYIRSILIICERERAREKILNERSRAAMFNKFINDANGGEQSSAINRTLSLRAQLSRSRREHYYINI
jgi:hypothetical protein